MKQISVFALLILITSTAGAQFGWDELNTGNILEEFEGDSLVYDNAVRVSDIDMTIETDPILTLTAQNVTDRPLRATIYLSLVHVSGDTAGVIFLETGVLDSKQKKQLTTPTEYRMIWGASVKQVTAIGITD
jgi:hypothetical protein